LLTSQEQEHLQQVAREIRKNIMIMLNRAGSGHPGGSLSLVEILTALYFHVINVDPHHPAWEKRDRLVLSKGHAAPVLYGVLAKKGFFPAEELYNLRKLGSILQGHPDMKQVPGVEISTGSLGQGLSVANGMALAARTDGADWRTYAVLGDGEIQEGQIWEAAMTSAHYRLGNLTAFLDYNSMQIDGRIEEVMSPLPVAEKWKAFGWEVIEIEGHDYNAIIDAVEKSRRDTERPTMIIAATVKGKGISFMEEQVDWHGKAPSAEELEQGLKDLGYQQKEEVT